MKKTILLLFIVVSFNSLKAQDSSEPSSGKGLFLGAKAGFGIVNYESILKGESNFAETTYNNLSYGIIAGYKLSGLLSVQLEGNYAQYGARNIIPTYIYSPQSPVLANVGINSKVKRVDMELYNVDVPLTIKLTLGSGNVSPYLYGGVNYGINVIGRALIIREITLNDIVDSRTSTDDITPRVISNEFAPIAGCGVMFNMFKISVFGDVRYKYGFTNLSNVDNHLGFTNSALWISAGLLLNL
jgi:Outer membrane protein beta-barrel domain